MFDNISLNRKVRKGKVNTPRNILRGGSDDTIFYKVALTFVFEEFESFAVRKDLKIPKNDGENGAVIIFDDGRISYFKRQSNQLNKEEFESILEVCHFLHHTYGGSVDAYVLCRPNVEIRSYDGIESDDVTILLATLKDYDGDAVVDMLENKRKNKEKFTFQDYVCHILLPYMGYEDGDEFLPKYTHYMMESMMDNDEKEGIEVVRF